VVWQDLRGSQRTEELIGAGFARLMIYFPAVKLEQVLRNLPNGFERANNGELAVGNVDSFLAWKLSNGAIHVTDASNASALGYFDFSGTWSWQENLLKLQGLPVTLLPNVVDSVGAIGYTDPGLLGAEVPIGSIIGDQQSALYGQGCVSPGMMKISYGTSAICNVNSGPEIKCPTGTYAFPAWTRDGVKTFLVEGIVITAGAVFDWLTRLGILDTIEQAASLAMEAKGTKGVSFLPALQGLGSPHNAFDRFGAFEGLTLGASKSHVVRAAIEGVTFRVREVVDSIYTNTGLPRPHIMRVDGGATENELLMQTQANVLGCTIEKMLPGEATAYGAALLAGEACGVWEPDCSRRLRRVERTWEPQWSNTERDGRFDRWKQAFGL
jgi:glycerol kinase